jgi:hypothetical protein
MECNTLCNYYNTERNICNDKDTFVSKLNQSDIVCRYDKNAVKFSLAKDKKK